MTMTNGAMTCHHVETHIMRLMVFVPSEFAMPIVRQMATWMPTVAPGVGDQVKSLSIGGTAKSQQFCDRSKHKSNLTCRRGHCSSDHQRKPKHNAGCDSKLSQEIKILETVGRST